MITRSQKRKKETMCWVTVWKRRNMIKSIRGHLNWKNPKKFSFWPNFSGPPPPLFEKGLYRRKRRYFVPNSNCKVRFFQNFNPPSPISEKSRTSPILLIEVAPKWIPSLAKTGLNHGKIKYRNCKPESSVICQYVYKWILFVQPIRSLI